MTRILMIKHGALGDVVQAMGAVRDVRLEHPDAELVVLTTPPYRAIFARCPDVDRVLTERRPRFWQLSDCWRLYRMLRRERFDRVYDLQNSGRTRLYRRLVIPDPEWIITTDRGRDESALQAWHRTLLSAGIEASNTLAPNVEWMADDVEQILADAGVRGRYVALIPGSSASHPDKRWPYYGELANRIREHTDFTPLTIPGPEEIDLCRSLPATALFTVNGNVLDWFALAGVLRQATFVVGNDTGPTHIAANLRRPGLALFGDHKSPASTGIERERFRALAVDDLARLPVETVYQAMNEALASSQR